MRHKRFILIAASIIAVILVVIFYPSDGKRIRRMLNGGAEAIMNEDIDRLMEYVSFNYSDGRGSSYLTFKKRAESVFNRFDNIQVEADVMAVNVHGEKAEADIKLSVIASEGSTRGYILGDAGGPEDIKVYLEKSPYVWKVVRADRAVSSQ